MKSVLLHASAETCDPDRGPAHYAMTLASAFDAHITALIFELDVIGPHSAHGREGTGAGSDLRAEPSERSQQRAQALRGVCERERVAVDVVTERSFAFTVPEVVADHARLRDVAVAGVDERGFLSEHAIAEYVLFQSGRPLIVVPAGFSKPFGCDTVMVAWDFGRTAARAVSDALPFLRRAGEVVLVAVGDEKRMDSSLSAADVVTALERRGVRARFELVEQGSRPIGDAISDSAGRFGADLLVMGGYGHSRFREFVLGGATRGILRDPALPTFLSH